MTAHVSVLFPSRGRPDLIKRTVAGLRGSAADPWRVEFCIGADPDDQETIDAVRALGVEPWVAPERLGYKQLHQYYNALAGRATGEWLFLWNDDAEMLTDRWDEAIGGPPGVLWPAADYAAVHNTFPVLPRAWYEYLGHLSLDQSVDMWLHEVGRMSGTLRRIPVEIHHLRVQDQTTAEVLAVASVQTFHTLDNYMARGSDAQAVESLVYL